MTSGSPEHEPRTASGVPDPGSFTLDEGVQLALRWLAASAKTQAAVEARLLRKGFDPGLAAAVTGRLVELGVIDDEEYGRMHVSRGLRRGTALQRLQAELESRGLSGAVAAAVLEERAGEADEAGRALALAQRWRREHAAIEPDTAFRRLAGWLSRKGYEQEVVEDVCRRVVGEPAAS
jgi:regulatory protein